MTFQTDRRSERGNILLVVVFIATAVAGLAALSSGRVVAETKQQRVLEDETQAFNSAYAQIHMAMNVVNNSAYNEQNQNLALRNAMQGIYGGTIEGGTKVDETYAFYYGKDGTGQLKYPGGEYSGYAKVDEKGAEVKSLDYGATNGWLEDPEGVEHGLVEGTNVRVYHGRDYIKRLQKLRGDKIAAVDPFGDSESYFILEAAGRVGGTVRLVSALVRENEPFSSFVFFQNKATLGVSGSPRGLTHANKTIAFYFPNGNYVDGVSVP